MQKEKKYYHNFSVISLNYSQRRFFQKWVQKKYRNCFPSSAGVVSLDRRPFQTPHAEPRGRKVEKNEPSFALKIEDVW